MYVNNSTSVRVLSCLEVEVSLNFHDEYQGQLKKTCRLCQQPTNNLFQTDNKL